jgi:trigger factor
MIQAEIEGRWRRLARYYNMSAETVMQMMAGAEDNKERDKEWRAAAEKALHSRIILETLMEEQNIEVTDEDVEKEFESIASESNAEVDEIKKHYDKQAVFYLKEEIKERRIIDLMLAENTLKPGKKENYLDFMTGNG